jgi:hypothetical protein
VCRMGVGDNGSQTNLKGSDSQRQRAGGIVFRDLITGNDHRSERMAFARRGAGESVECAMAARDVPDADVDMRAPK